MPTGSSATTGPPLAGGGGPDTLEGGRGTDIYLVGSTRTVIVERRGEAADIVLAKVSSTLTGGDAVENLIADGTRPIGLTGNNTKITGNDARSVLGGLEGNDRLYGGDGRDDLRGGSGNDTLYRALRMAV